MSITLVDTGPLVAYLGGDDREHDWALAVFDSLPSPLLTCEAVITETCFLMLRRFKSCDLVLQMVDRGVIEIRFSLAIERARIRNLMQRYADTPMSLADACLVRMSELLPDSRVLTMDSDFAVYRRNGRQAIPLLTPFA